MSRGGKRTAQRGGHWICKIRCPSDELVEVPAMLFGKSTTACPPHLPQRGAQTGRFRGHGRRTRRRRRRRRSQRWPRSRHPETRLAAKSLAGNSCSAALTPHTAAKGNSGNCGTIITAAQTWRQNGTNRRREGTGSPWPLGGNVRTLRLRVQIISSTAPRALGTLWQFLKLVPSQ